MTLGPNCEPSEPADGRSCDWGNCDEESVGWRWSRDLAEWLPVCERHISHRSISASNIRRDPPVPSDTEEPQCPS